MQKLLNLRYKFSKMDSSSASHVWSQECSRNLIKIPSVWKPNSGLFERNLKSDKENQRKRTSNNTTATIDSKYWTQEQYNDIYAAMLVTTKPIFRQKLLRK